MPPEDSLNLFPPEPLDSAETQGRAGAHAPLADRMRPRTLDEVIGQDHLLGAGAALRSLSESDALPSLILWGPPGCGKTTLARLLALHAGAHFEPISAVPLGVGQTYYVASTHLAGDGDEWLFDPASLIVASEITYDSRRFIRSSALVFPFRVGCITCDTGYFGGNFQFQVIPEPNTLLLLSLGIVGLGLRRRARLA